MVVLSSYVQLQSIAKERKVLYDPGIEFVCYENSPACGVLLKNRVQEKRQLRGINVR